MQYRGLLIQHRYIHEVGHYVGQLINADDVIVVSAPTLKEVTRLMQEAIDDYLLTGELA